MTEHQQAAAWNVSDWHGKMLVDCHGEKIGKLQDVYVDVETDEPQFATVKEGVIDRHLTFVPVGGTTVGPGRAQGDGVSRPREERPEHRTARRRALSGR
jgi:sporulation protein YlmC with PRC-barrel domain